MFVICHKPTTNVKCFLCVACKIHDLLYSPGLIDRSLDDESPKSPLPIDKPFELVQKDFDLSDACDFARCAMEVCFVS